jgi:hypothetical protein
VTQIDLAALEADPAAVRHYRAPVLERILQILAAADDLAELRDDPQTANECRKPAWAWRAQARFLSLS